MKRTLLLIGVFLLLFGLSYYLTAERGPKKGLKDPSRAFALQENEDINRVFIADRTGRRLTLSIEEGAWMVNKKYPVRPWAIKHFLNVMKSLRLQFIPTEQAQEHIMRHMTAEGLKVEYYNKEGKFKTYYVGGVTSDERGTYYLMEGYDIPYVIENPYGSGGLRQLYNLSEEDWRDKAIFNHGEGDIKKLEVNYPSYKNKSFVIEQKGSSYQVSPYYKTTSASKKPIKKGAIEAYLMNYKQIYSEGFENNYPRMDSIRSMVPFSVITLTNEAGEKHEVSLWPFRKKDDGLFMQMTVERYFVDINEDDFMLAQIYALREILRGYNFFFEE